MIAPVSINPKNEGKRKVMVKYYSQIKSSNPMKSLRIELFLPYVKIFLYLHKNILYKDIFALCIQSVGNVTWFTISNTVVSLNVEKGIS